MPATTSGSLDVPRLGRLDRTVAGGDELGAHGAVEDERAVTKLLEQIHCAPPFGDDHRQRPSLSHLRKAAVAPVCPSGVRVGRVDEALGLVAPDAEADGEGGGGVAAREPGAPQRPPPPSPARRASSSRTAAAPASITSVISPFTAVPNRAASSAQRAAHDLLVQLGELATDRARGFGRQGRKRSETARESRPRLEGDDESAAAAPALPGGLQVGRAARQVPDEAKTVVGGEARSDHGRDRRGRARQHGQRQLGGRGRGDQTHRRGRRHRAGRRR